MVKNPPAMQETWVQSLGWEDPLEEGLATHSSILAWRSPMDCKPPGSSVHRIFQARILERVAISFSRGSSNPGIEPGSPELKADSLPSELPGKPPFTLDWYSYIYIPNTF